MSVLGDGVGTSASENREIGTVVALKAPIEGFGAIAGTDLTIAELSDPACDVWGRARAGWRTRPLRSSACGR